MAKTHAQDRSVRRVWTRFFFYAFGVFLVYSAYGTLLSLQSSINVVNGLGTTGLATIYIFAVVFTLLFAPAILRKYEAKRCVCCSEIVYLIYVLANIYPAFYTIIPASAIVGMGDCILWTCFPIMNTFFANLYSSVSGKTSPRSHETRFSGYFFGIFQMAKVIGNIISYAVLYGFNSQYQSGANISSTMNHTKHNSSMAPYQILVDYSHCGANDCQDAEQVDNTIAQYVPANNWALYVLLAVMALLCIAAITIHIIFIPNTEDFLALRRKGSVNRYGSKNDKTKSPIVRQTGDNNKDEDLVKDDTAILPREEFKNIADTKDEAEKKGPISFAVASAKDVGIQLVGLKQLLLTPMILYAGLGFGFVTSEITRSYSSCVFGVSWVPVHSLFFGVGATIVCYISGKLSKRISRNVLVVAGAMSDTAIYLYTLFWNPNKASHITVIPIYFLLGGANGGIWVPATQVLQVICFPDRLDVSSPVWNFWFMSGIAIAFAWSTSMCVNAKIYIQLGMLVLSVLGYGILEKTRRSEKHPDAEET